MTGSCSILFQVVRSFSLVLVPTPICLNSMRLLIITQKIDVKDPVLGFFHGWLLEFAKHFEKITVICLGAGEYHLPANIEVLSLGKEKKVSKISYIFSFYKYIFLKRNEYGCVFVHMNEEYVLLGGVFWKMLGKKVLMWRNHRNGSFLTDAAVYLSDKVFCTSKDSYTARFKKTKLMPVGIDTSFFKKSTASAKKRNSLLFFGRISPIKKVEIFIEACRLLKEKKVNFSAEIVGDAPSRDYSYYNSVKMIVEQSGLDGFVLFKPAINFSEAPSLYNQYDIYVNATPTGSFDKTIFEALACETLVVTSNQALHRFLDDKFIFSEGDSSQLADRLHQIFELSEDKKTDGGIEGRKRVVTVHSLSLLAGKIAEEVLSS